MKGEAEKTVQVQKVRLDNARLLCAGGTKNARCLDHQALDLADLGKITNNSNSSNHSSNSSSLRSRVDYLDRRLDSVVRQEQVGVDEWLGKEFAC